ncbi:MAG: phage minor capsid protein [Clostridia bacterium]|nr:phage minor capsid protein [Clostridia bacterium]
MTDDEELRKVFERYQKLLFKAANSTQSEMPYSFVAEFSHKMDAANLNFKQLARRYIDKAIPDVDMSASAESVLRSAGAFHETANVKLTTYVQMVSKLTESAEQFKERIQAHIAEDEKNGTTTTVTDLKEYIRTELRTGQGMAITYSNGARMPTDKYAEMLARTTRIETQNIAMLGKALDDGNDLVECSTISPTCSTCAVYQGRIYSISGNTPGYPALYKTAFRNGYSCIHPNCRHQFFPYNPKFHTEEERAQLEKDTRRPMDEEKLSDSARSAYARSQMQMRQWNKEMNEFAMMRERYGDNAPYKTLGAFRRAYRSEEGSLPYAKTHYYRKDERQFTEFESAIGKENMPENLAKFQQMKYNDREEFNLLNHYQFSRKKGNISALASFELFKTTKVKIENATIGKMAANGTVIQKVSLHFVDRLIGTIYHKDNEPKHEGMALKDMQDILFNGVPSSKLKYDKFNRPSQNIEIESKGIVTVNTDTGELVQCNKKGTS